MLSSTGMPVGDFCMYNLRNILYAIISSVNNFDVMPYLYYNVLEKK